MKSTAAAPSPELLRLISEAIGARSDQVRATIAMLDGGDTVPFIARYRKEATGGLDDGQLRLLEERLGYLRELGERRQAILDSIEEQGKLDPALRAAIEATITKSALEDLYLPYRKKRRTRGQIAIEAGLQPLADTLWNDPSQEPESVASGFVGSEREVADTKAALDGARSILVERFAEDAKLIDRLRTKLVDQGHLCAELLDDKLEDAQKFRDYFDHQEPLGKAPGYRALAMFRGRREGVLRLALKVQNAAGEYDTEACETLVAGHLGFVDEARPADAWRRQVVRHVWRVKLSMHLETDLFNTLRERADSEAIRVFADNLRDLLLAAPAGARCTLGLDPGFRSGVKVCVIDATGKLVGYDTIYPHVPQRQWQRSLATLEALCRQHAVELVAVGNGTASRETDQLVTELLGMKGLQGLTRVSVSEAGASVYSASALAEREFPDVDVTIRGAVSIARRLQDPLAELVKIEPKAIGVGQYQHDVSQVALARSLDATVEDCVNRVGVDLNTASSALLSRVAGLSGTLAENIVTWRDEHGAFAGRRALLKVPRLGPRAFEQCAGFLRVSGGDDPLDASGVHPESYPVVQRILASLGKPLEAVMGDSGALSALSPQEFTDERFGVPTVRDILAELEKPGRDPRPEFRTARFETGVNEIGDLTLDQVLEGVVTNVTDFGAFVDIGVHQDGLVHISAMSEQFVKDPRQVVTAGAVVKVKVMSVDVPRKRIALTMRLADAADAAAEHGENGRGARGGSGGGPGDRSREPAGGAGRHGHRARGRSARSAPGQGGQDGKGAKAGESRPTPAGASPSNSAMADQLRAALLKD